MKHGILLASIGMLFSLTFQVSYGMIEDKREEGKLHLGTVLTAMTGRVCNLKHEDKSDNYVAPLYRMAIHMTGERPFSLTLYKVVLPKCKEYFCKKHPGFGDFVEKEDGIVKKAIKEMEEKKKEKAPAELWRTLMLKYAGEVFFKIPEETDFSDDAYYLKVKKDCLKSMREEKTPFESDISNIKDVNPKAKIIVVNPELDSKK